MPKALKIQSVQNTKWHLLTAKITFSATDLQKLKSYFENRQISNKFGVEDSIATLSLPF